MSNLKNESTYSDKHDFNTDFIISSDYLSKLDKSFKFSLRISIVLIIFGIILIIIGQSFRSNDSIGIFFSFIAIIGLLIAIFGFLTLIRDIQLSNLSKIGYNLVVEPRGIAVFQNNISTTEPISFFPFNAIIASEIVSVSRFLKKGAIPNISSVKFEELSPDLNGVLLHFKMDHHILKTNRQQVFFDIPDGYSLFILEDCENFLKMIKNKQIS